MENKTKSGNETTNIETKAIGPIKDDKNKNETTNIEIKKEAINMEEKKNIDMGKEFGQTITETMIYDQYLTQAIKILDNFNPVERVFSLREHMPDEETKKMVDNFGKSDMPVYLEAYKRMATEDGIQIGRAHV